MVGILSSVRNRPGATHHKIKTRAYIEYIHFNHPEKTLGWNFESQCWNIN